MHTETCFQSTSKYSTLGVSHFMRNINHDILSKRQRQVICEQPRGRVAYLLLSADAIANTICTVQLLVNVFIHDSK